MRIGAGGRFDSTGSGLVSVAARVMSGMVVTAAPVPNTSQLRWPWPLRRSSLSCHAAAGWKKIVCLTLLGGR